MSNANQYPKSYDPRKGLFSPAPSKSKRRRKRRNAKREKECGIAKWLTPLIALAFLTGCASMSRPTITVKCRHIAPAQLLAGLKQNDGAYKLVVSERGKSRHASVMRDGEYLNNDWIVVQLYDNPNWPCAAPVATQVGTPEELGLLAVKPNAKRTPRWWLVVDEVYMNYALYLSAIERWGTDAVVLAKNDERWWVQVRIDGKTRIARMKGFRRYGFYGSNPRGDGWASIN